MSECTKRAWDSERAAQRQAKILGGKSGHFMRAYLCDNCYKYHLTSQDRRLASGHVAIGDARTHKNVASSAEELEEMAKRMRG